MDFKFYHKQNFFKICLLLISSIFQTFQSSSINEYLEQKNNQKPYNLIASQPKRSQLINSKPAVNTPFYSISTSNINYKSYLSGFASDTKKLKKPFNTESYKKHVFQTSNFSFSHVS